jgi:hypothetical protein
MTKIETSAWHDASLARRQSPDIGAELWQEPLFAMLQRNLSGMDFNLLLPDVRIFADEVAHSFPM